MGLNVWINTAFEGSYGYMIFKNEKWLLVRRQPSTTKWHFA